MAEHEPMKHEKIKELKKESHHREKAEPFYDQLKAAYEGVADIIVGLWLTYMPACWPISAPYAASQPNNSSAAERRKL